MKQYRDLVSKVLAVGTYRTDRTGTGAYSIFGDQMEFNLAYGFPLLTGKKMFTRGIFEELDWILAGSTNNHDLVDKNVHIWDEWAIKDQVDRSVFDRSVELRTVLDEKFGANAPELPVFQSNDELNAWLSQYLYDNSRISLPNIARTEPGPRDGDLGPIYGKQWRQWTGDMIISHDHGKTWSLFEPGDSEVQIKDALVQQYEIDQIQTVIDLLKNDPFSRRICVSAWNPGQQHRMRLAPCHAFFQFFVERIDEAELYSEFTREQWLAYLDFLTGLNLPDEPLKALSVRAQKVDAYFKAHGICNLRLSCKLTQR